MTEQSSILAFLERLSVDDAFREEVVAHPEDKLNEYEIAFESEDIPTLVNLPPKEVMQARLNEFAEALGQGEPVFGIWMQIVEPPP